MMVVVSRLRLSNLTVVVTISLYRSATRWPRSERLLIGTHGRGCRGIRIASGARPIPGGGQLGAEFIHRPHQPVVGGLYFAEKGFQHHHLLTPWSELAPTRPPTPL